MNKKTQRRFSGESGMTLIELAFAAGILATALAMLFGSLVNITAAGTLSEGKTIATSHASTVLEELQSIPDLRTLLEYVPPEFDDSRRDEFVQIELFRDDGTSILLPVDSDTFSEVLPNPLTIRCTISWSDVRGRPMSVSVSKLHCR